MASYIADYKAIAIANGHRVKVLNLRQKRGCLLTSRGTVLYLCNVTGQKGEETLPDPPCEGGELNK